MAKRSAHAVSAPFQTRRLRLMHRWSWVLGIGSVIDLSGAASQRAFLTNLDAEGTLASDEARLRRSESQFRASDPIAHQRKHDQPQQSTEMPEWIAAAERAAITIRLNTYLDNRRVGDEFRAGQAILVDLREMPEVDALRSVDFAAGLAFGLRGAIVRISRGVFLLAPAEGSATSGQETYSASDSRQSAVQSREQIAVQVERVLRDVGRSA